MTNGYPAMVLHKAIAKQVVPPLVPAFHSKSCDVGPQPAGMMPAATVATFLRATKYFTAVSMRSMHSARCHCCLVHCRVIFACCIANAFSFAPLHAISKLCDPSFQWRLIPPMRRARRILCSGTFSSRVAASKQLLQRWGLSRRLTPSLLTKRRDSTGPLAWL